ncbi:MAG: LuxR C-terminal-related transcriptional regulator [Acidimicrobiia bacterium]|nr:LuxR C-terminal-related transcriptional regulator [Acidimicrobiia bacterium]
MTQAALTRGAGHSGIGAQMFVGRDREVELVAEHVQRGRPVAVVGPVGIGKTALATRACSSTTERTETLVFLQTLCAVPYGGARRWIPDLGAAGDEALAAELMLDELSAAGGGALLFDNLQWADPQTRTTVKMLAGKAPLVVTARDSASAELTTDLRTAGFEVVELAGLPDQLAAQLVASLREDWTPDEIDHAVARAGGNPLLCIELASGNPVPGEIESWMRDRLDELPPESREAMCLLALLGRPATADEVDGPAVDVLVERGVAIRTDRAGVAIRYGLLAELAVEELDVRRRRRLHGILADRLQSADERLAHASAAGRSADVVAGALQAAADATSTGSRAAFLGLAARHAAADDHEIHLEAAGLAIAAGEGAQALEILDTLEQPAASGRDWALHRSQALWDVGKRDEAHAVLDTEIARLDDAAAVAVLSQRAMLELFEVPGSPAGFEMATRAIATADATAASAHRARFALGFTQLVLGSPDWSDTLDTALAESEAAADTPATWWIREALILGRILSGRVDDARVLADDVASAAADHLLLKRQRLFETYAMMVALFQGRYRDVLTGTAQLLRRPCDDRTAELVQLTRTMALIDVGADIEAREQLRSLQATGMAGPGGRGFAAILQAEADYWRGRTAKAVQGFAAALEALPAFHFYAPLGVLSSAWAAVEAETPIPARGFIPPVPLLAHVHREWDGLEEWSRNGAGSDVVDLLVDAASGWSGKLMRNELRCLWGAGEAARLSGDPRAGALLADVEQRCRRAGLGPLLWRARRSLRQAGISPRQHTLDDNTDVLTALEQQVLETARTGASNSEIARRLGISASTVTYYFRRIDKKLGTGSRHSAVLSGTSSAQPPLVVVRGDDEAFAATAEAMRAGGWAIVRAADSGAQAGDEAAAASRTITTTRIRDSHDVEAVLLAALAGRGVLVHVDAASPLADQLLADLRRIGPVDIRGASGETLSSRLDADEQALLDLFALGMAADEAAHRLGWSRRTVFRRLARIRESLGVETTADAVAVHVHQGSFA